MGQTVGSRIDVNQRFSPSHFSLGPHYRYEHTFNRSWAPPMVPFATAFRYLYSFQQTQHREGQFLARKIHPELCLGSHCNTKEILSLILYSSPLSLKRGRSLLWAGSHHLLHQQPPCPLSLTCTVWRQLGAATRFKGNTVPSVDIAFLWARALWRPVLKLGKQTNR